MPFFYARSCHGCGAGRAREGVILALGNQYLQTSDMATILVLPRYASLVTLKNGETVFTLGEQRYRRDEVIPSTLLASVMIPGLQCTAGHYIEHCLTQQFGADKATEVPSVFRLPRSVFHAAVFRSC